MRGLRIKYFVFSILAILSLFSVGFASWVTINDSDITISGSIVVDNVLDSNNYITCNNMQVFKYFKTGFVSDDNKIVNTGSISFDFVINNKTCKENFKDDQNLDISLQLESNNLVLFNGDIISMEVKKDNEIQNPLFSTDKNICVLPITITNFHSNSDTITLHIEYVFTILNTEKFSNEVYPILITDNFNFALSAKLTGSVGD